MIDRRPIKALADRVVQHQAHKFGKANQLEAEDRFVNVPDRLVLEEYGTDKHPPKPWAFRALLDFGSHP